MRQINIVYEAARSASGKYIQPEFKVWQAREVNRTVKSRALRTSVLAYSRDVEELERLFPTAHNEHKHMVVRKTNHCTNKNCWRYDHAG